MAQAVNSNLPNIILLLSGKRKSGKDFLAEHLVNILGSEFCEIIRISEPIKHHYATHKNLNLETLMSDNPYKENFRLQMIKWSEDVRKETPGYFCEAACAQATLKPIWLVSDIRRKSDIHWFKELYRDKLKFIRISADLDVRQKRGFIFKEGVDDAASECDLDDFMYWDVCVKNNNEQEFQDGVLKIQNLLECEK